MKLVSDAEIRRMKWRKFKKRLSDFGFVLMVVLMVLYAWVLSLFGKRVK